MRFMFVNVQSVTNKIGILDDLFRHYGVNVACLSETWLRRSDAESLIIGDMLVASHFSRSVNTHGGSLILLRPNTNYTIVNEINNCSVEMHCEFAATFLRDMKLILISVYRPPSGNFYVFLDKIELALNFVDVRSIRVIIGGDFNIHFGTSDVKVKLLRDLMNSFNLTDYVFFHTRGNRTLDNVFANFHIPGVEHVEPVADHASIVIRFECLLSKPLKLKRIIRPITDRGKFILYSSLSTYA